MTALGVAVAGALGALARYGLTAAIGRPADGRFPWATFSINVSGSFVLGVLVALLTDRFSIDPSLRAALTVGFLGAYTTFSTFSLETVRLVEHGATGTAVAYVIASVAAGLAALYLGLSLARAL